MDKNLSGERLVLGEHGFRSLWAAVKTGSEETHTDVTSSGVEPETLLALNHD
jgi:hypothetical protein